MRWNGFNIYPALLSVLMLLSVTLAPLVYAQVDESTTLVTLDYVALPDEPSKHGHSHDVDETHDSTPSSHLRLKCCVDQLRSPPNSDIYPTGVDEPPANPGYFKRQFQNFY